MRPFLFFFATLITNVIHLQAMDKENLDNEVPRKAIQVPFASEPHEYEGDTVYLEAKSLLAKSPSGSDEDEWVYLNVVYHLLKEMADSEERKKLYCSMKDILKNRKNLGDCLDALSGLFDIPPDHRIEFCKEIKEFDPGYATYEKDRSLYSNPSL